MSFNGSGLFVINSAGQPVVFNTIIDNVVFNAFTADIAVGLSNCVTRDGQSPATASLPMGGFKLTGLGVPTAAADSARMDTANSKTCEFRLTLTTGVPVTTADVTAAETLFVTPYGGNSIALYDGSTWLMRTSAEMSIDIPDATNCYDVFVFDSAGTPTVELTAWTNDTTRATALVYQNGVLVKTGATTRRYLGTFYCTTAGNGQTEDSVANRFVWNYYNRVARPMRVMPSGTWNYTLLTYRQANADTANQLNLCVGVDEQPVHAKVANYAENGTVPCQVSVAMGLDSTTTQLTTSLGGSVELQVAGGGLNVWSEADISTGVGRHFIAMLEISAATGTTAWTPRPGNLSLGGIHGVVFG